MPWTPTQQKYQLWLSVPSKVRADGLKTRKDAATALGVDEDVLLLWEATAGFWDDTFAIARAIIGHKLADILEATAREAVRGSVAAQKLAYQVLGVAAENVQHRIAIEDDRLVVVLHSAPASTQSPVPAQQQLRGQLGVRLVEAADAAEAEANQG